MVKEVLIPKENLAQVEEVREIENKDLEREKKPITETLKEKVLPVAHASDDDERAEKMAAKSAIGTVTGAVGVVCPPAGAVISGAGKLTGEIMESVGDDTNNEDLKEAGKIVGTGTGVGGLVGAGVGKAAEATVDVATAPVKLMQELAKNA